MKKALICGISGQDGVYLTQLLLDKGYQVIGTSRANNASGFTHLNSFGLHNRVKLVVMALNDFRSVLNVLASERPDEIYNLAGQSSVGLSFEQPVETIESINIATLNILESIRFLKLDSRLYNAGSSECFGDTTAEHPATEKSCFQPRSPYAVAKASAHWLIVNYREAYQVYACTGHLFNHESPCRGERFVTKKIISSAVRIAQGKQTTLQLGNLDIIRDWGWAPDYVEAMWLMLQQEQSQLADYIIATGHSVSLKYFVQKTFSELNLDINKYLLLNDSLLRPTDLRAAYANPEKAYKELNWKAQYHVDDVIKMMIKNELK